MTNTVRPLDLDADIIAAIEIQKQKSVPMYAELFIEERSIALDTSVQNSSAQVIELPLSPETTNSIPI